ncbi:MAG: 50S ribosomal protein L18 [Phycisphaerales bacterium]|jgi:large subunit ribosomal protein L18|nr:50S ribosomal protein L18 [Phycisphaerales bacterium]
MDKNSHKQVRRQRRRVRIRRSIIGTAERPRLSVFKSLNHMYAQLIDDLAGRTLAAASTKEKGTPTDKTGNCSAASDVGTRLAERAKAAGVASIVFDRGGFRYHGRVKALADAARKGGLKF